MKCKLHSMFMVFLLGRLPILGNELALMNPDILESSPEDSIAIFRVDSKDVAWPLSFQVDVQHGIYVSASVFYSPRVDFEEARIVLNRKYKGYEVANFSDDSEMGLWRHDDDGYAICLRKTKHAGSSAFITVTYIRFQEKQDFINSLKRVKSLLKEDATYDQDHWTFRILDEIFALEDNAAYRGPLK